MPRIQTWIGDTRILILFFYFYGCITDFQKNSSPNLEKTGKS